MIDISFLRPIDQFNGTCRFLNELQKCLESDRLNELRLSVAFAKNGPLLRLAPSLDEWKRNGKSVEAIIGIDHVGTSKQALEFALHYFDKVYITYSTAYVTFHPKFYLFSGPNHAICYTGSHNLTVGGTETNFEAGVKIEMDRPENESLYQEALSVWMTLLPDRCAATLPLDQAIVDYLFEDGLVFDENNMKHRLRQISEEVPEGSTTDTEPRKRTQGLFRRIFSKPPSPIPKQVFIATPASSQPQSLAKIKTISTDILSDTLIIQIVPHHNGEILLSKRAIDQNPRFFCFPFTGRTVPKKASNSFYPQRVPDPIVNIRIYNHVGDLIYTKLGFSLNTIYYESRSEIRITVSPDLLQQIEPYSIMVMRLLAGDYDYDIDIYNPSDLPSKQYMAYLDVCNQTLPSGGSARARKMGWL